MIEGVHYLELIEPIKQLKRDGRLEEALTLCYAPIEGAENGRDGRVPAPWYTEQAAITHRKRGQKNQEIAVLERWLRFVPMEARSNTELGARLAKINRWLPQRAQSSQAIEARAQAESLPERGNSRAVSRPRLRCHQ